jgi:phytanoyl-CoA hydroxylase
VWRLPIAEAEFNSLFEIQEGSLVKSSGKSSTGYFSHEVDAEEKPSLAG